MRRKMIVFLCLCLMLTGCKAFGGEAGGWKENNSEMTEYDNTGKTGSEGEPHEMIVYDEYHRLDDDFFTSAATADEGLSLLKNNANEYYTEDVPKFVKTLRLGEGKFELWQSAADGNVPAVIYTGSYALDQSGALSFIYKVMKQGSNDIKADGKSADAEKMKGMSSLGSYTDYVNPPAARVQRSDIYSEIPIMLKLPLTEMPYAITEGRYAMRLYLKGAFICAPAYGAEVKGSYEAGKDLELSFDPTAIFTENELYSDTAFFSEDQKQAFIKEVTDAVGTEEKTTISFSGGKWVWKAGKKTISKGKYSESTEYPGFVRMWAGDGSNANVQSWFYITEDGIYYPFMIQTKQVEK
ncbi:MAG: hypothetical protein IKO44_05110 [Ruminococcus sp.]|nr:hypothetical protein [Ruminococcus sp.]